MEEGKQRLFNALDGYSEGKEVMCVVSDQSKRERLKRKAKDFQSVSPYFPKKKKMSVRLSYKKKRFRHLDYPRFKPLKSPFDLIQESLYMDPWKLLIATIFLNRTTGKAAIPILWTFFDSFPDASSVLKGDASKISQIMKPLGLFRKRADIIIKFSKEYITKDWVYPIQLYGIGKYGDDSYRIFCCGAEWTDVRPRDHMLNKYYEWLKGEFKSGRLDMDESWYPSVTKNSNSDSKSTLS